MANKKQKKASELKGFNIYQDPKKGTVLYDWLTRKGYQLTTSDVGTYSLSQAFLPVSVVLVYGLYRFFKMDMYKAIIISIIAYIVMRLIYRIKFLNKLPAIENYKRPDDGNIFQNAAKKYSKARLILLIILAVALVGVSIAYLLTSELGNIEKIGMYLLTAAASAMFLFGLIALIIKKNDK